MNVASQCFAMVGNTDAKDLADTKAAEYLPFAVQSQRDYTVCRRGENIVLLCHIGGVYQCAAIGTAGCGLHGLASAISGASASLEMEPHPDVFLALHGQLREICCLYVPTGEMHPLMVWLEKEKASSRLSSYACGAWRNGFWVLFPAFSMWQQEVRSCLEACGLTGGISGPYERPASARGCLRRARMAWQARGKSVMGDFGTLRLTAFHDKAMAILQAEGLLQSDFVNRTLCCIRKSDLETGTQYGDSLQAYLTSGLNMRTAADALGVHRNTLDYRIQKIQEKFGLDLSDRNICFELLFSYRMAEKAWPDMGNGTFSPAAAQYLLWLAVEGKQGNGDFSCRLGMFDLSHSPDSVREKMTARLWGMQMPVAFDEDFLVVAFADNTQTSAQQEKELRDMQAREDVYLALTQPMSAGRMAAHTEMLRLTLQIARKASFATGTIESQNIMSMLYFAALSRRADLTDYLSDAVIRVMDYDADKGTKLSQSLYVYLLHFMDLKTAARQLGVHRNTMEYQLRRIEELLGGVLDEQMRFDMICTYKILALP